MGLEVVLDDHVATKLCKTNYVLQIVVIFTIFSPGLNHVFGQKLEVLS